MLHEIGGAVMDRVVAGLERGLSLQAAAALAGTSGGTVRKWILSGTPDPSTGQVEEPRYREFAERCLEARAKAEAKALDAVLRAAEDQDVEELEYREVDGPEGKTTTKVKRSKRVRGAWQAAAWYLERARGEVYGPQVDPSEQAIVHDRKEIVLDIPAEQIALLQTPLVPIALPGEKASTESPPLNGNGHLNGNGKHA